MRLSKGDNDFSDIFGESDIFKKVVKTAVNVILHKLHVLLYSFHGVLHYLTHYF